MLTVNNLSGFGSKATFKTTVIPVSSDWTQIGSNLTFGTGTFDATGEACARTVDSFDGDFVLTATVNSETNWNFGCFAASEVNADATVFNSSTGNGIKGINHSYSYNGGDDSLFFGSARQGAGGAGGTWSQHDVLTIKRVGTTVTFMKNTSDILAFSQASTVALMIMLGAGGTTDINDIQWVI